MRLHTLQVMAAVAFLAITGGVRAAPEVQMPLYRVPTAAEVDRLAENVAETTPPLRMAVPGIAHAWRMNDLVTVGSGPPDADAMQALHQAGVKTLISIDFFAPDFYLAANHGMAYVHVPMRYGRINSGELMNLLRVTSWMEGHYYLHAAPGEQRALPVAAIAAGWLERQSSERALYLLRATNFPLSHSTAWADLTGRFYYISRTEISAVPEDFPERVGLPPLIWWMRHMNESFIALREAARFHWQSPPNFPETSPLAEAETIARDLERLQWLRSDAQPDHRQGMSQAAAQARALEQALRREDPSAADQAWEALTYSCLQCHLTHRDIE